MIDSGGINRLGNIDNTVGGDSSRYSLMAEWNREETNGRTHVDVYVGRYDMDLFSNFTYFLEDPENGDQFEQGDGRWFLGGEVRREWDYGTANTFTVGLQTRHDFLSGITLGHSEGFYGSLRSRFFSSRPLVEDGTVESRPSWQLNGRLGYRNNDWEIALDVLNILGRDDNDIEYFYTSRLPGGPLAGVDNVHLHPTEPRTFRVSLTKRF